jgi:hypothetical protein
MLSVPVLANFGQGQQYAAGILPERALLEIKDNNALVAHEHLH